MALSTDISDNRCPAKTSCWSISVLASPSLSGVMPCTIRFRARRPPRDSPDYVWYPPRETASLAFCVLLSRSPPRLRSSLITSQAADGLGRVWYLA